MDRFRRIFATLDKEAVKYLIVGGVAVNLYGYLRYTGDIDIILALDDKNLSAMDRAMNKLGYIKRLPIEIHELGNSQKVKKWLKEKGMTAYTFISGKGVGYDIYILASDSFDFNRYAKKQKKISAWGMQLPVIHIDDLIKMKRRANRDKDLIDLKVLLQLKNL